MTINTKIAGIWVGESHPVRLLGVLNLSPESFYKGSVVDSQDLAVNKAKQMVDDGAEFLDLGAMSTAPGVKNISADEERNRLIPILKAVSDEVNVPISVDTFRAEVAKEALDNGAKIINDVSGFTQDPNMVDVITEYGSPAIIMATQNTIGDPLTISNIIDSLKQSLKLIEEHDYDSNKIIIDPAIGRWVPNKTYRYNINIIKNLKKFTQLNHPILVGISRKSFIHEILNRPEPSERLYGTLSATAIAVYNGAHIVRTHDVAETADAVRLAKIIRNIELDDLN